MSLVLPDERPTSGCLLGPDGHVVARHTTMRASRMRLMRLDHDGCPVGEPVELGAAELVTWQRDLDDVSCVDPAPFPTDTVRIDFVHHAALDGDRARGAYHLQRSEGP